MWVALKESARMCEKSYGAVESIHGNDAVFSKHMKKIYAEIIKTQLRGTLWQVQVQNRYFPLVDCKAKIIFIYFVP